MLKDFTKEKFDVIIQAGQSNAEGYGFGSTDSPFENDGRVWALNANDTISLAAETVAVNSPRTDFSLSFAREYLKSGRLKEGRKLLIIRAAVGGTGFLDCHWGPKDDLRLKMHDMIKTALTLNTENRLVALLWHQGEQDAVQNASFETHYGHLMTLVKDVRAAFSEPSLPFIAGDFVKHWENENPDICAPVVDAMRAVCRDCENAGFVETDGLKSNAQFSKEHPFGWDDNIHFCRDALYDLGARYYSEFERIMKTTE